MFRKEVAVPYPVIVPDRRTEYVDRDITVNRAPTDESVKLLREMEHKAESEVIKAVRVGDTSFECVMHYSLDPMQDQTTLRAIFKVNGKQMTATVQIDPREFEPGTGLHKPFEALRDEIAKVLAGEILHDAFIGAMSKRF